MPASTDVPPRVPKPRCGTMVWGNVGDASVVFRAPGLSADPGVVHGFTSRVDAHGEALNLGTGASPSVWDRLSLTVTGRVQPVAFASQVHGATVLRATTGGLVGEADAIWTDVPGVLLAIRTADCVPVVVAGEGIVAVIHAGWRGLAAGVIGETVNAMPATGPLRAVVGPAICMGCYEVGSEVVSALGRWGPVEGFADLSGHRPHVDPGAAAVAQLRRSGVAAVERIAVCSQCDSRLWSHRQEGARAGRQAGVVGLTC